MTWVKISNVHFVGESKAAYHEYDDRGPWAVFFSDNPGSNPKEVITENLRNSLEVEPTPIPVVKNHRLGHHHFHHH